MALLPKVLIGPLAHSTLPPAGSRLRNDPARMGSTGPRPSARATARAAGAAGAHAREAAFATQPPSVGANPPRPSRPPAAAPRLGHPCTKRRAPAPLYIRNRLSPFALAPACTQHTAPRRADGPIRRARAAAGASQRAFWTPPSPSPLVVSPFPPPQAPELGHPLFCASLPFFPLYPAWLSRPFPILPTLHSCTSLVQAPSPASPPLAEPAHPHAARHAPPPTTLSTHSQPPARARALAHAQPQTVSKQPRWIGTGRFERRRALEDEQAGGVRGACTKPGGAAAPAPALAGIALAREPRGAGARRACGERGERPRRWSVSAGVSPVGLAAPSPAPPAHDNCRCGELPGGQARARGRALARRGPVC